MSLGTAISHSDWIIWIQTSFTQFKNWPCVTSCPWWRGWVKIKITCFHCRISDWNPLLIQVKEAVGIWQIINFFRTVLICSISYCGQICVWGIVFSYCTTCRPLTNMAKRFGCGLVSNLEVSSIKTTGMRGEYQFRRNLSISWYAMIVILINTGDFSWMVELHLMQQNIKQNKGNKNNNNSKNNNSNNNNKNWTASAIIYYATLIAKSVSWYESYWTCLGNFRLLNNEYTQQIF